MRGETPAECCLELVFKFQSTPLMRGETQQARIFPLQSSYFNPLPSCEGRPVRRLASPLMRRFQSTPLMRGETFGRGWRPRSNSFQSTPLMRGETILRLVFVEAPLYFNPLPSCEGRPSGPQAFMYVWQISIHSPHARGDHMFPNPDEVAQYFNPLPSCEGRRQRRFSGATCCNFNPLPSCEGRPPLQ